MKCEDVIQRCYELVDLNRGYAEETKKIHRYERNPMCTNFINAVQRYAADVIYPFVSRLSNMMHSGAPVDPEWVERNLQRFEAQTEAHRMTLEMLKTMPAW